MQQDSKQPAFFNLLTKLKRKQRHGWLKRKVDGDTIAEHCFGSDYISWCIACESECDVGRVAELSVIHELVMAVIEDATPDNATYDDKPSIEDAAVPRLMAHFSKQVQNRFLVLWYEFREQNTIESQIVREAAKLDSLFEAERIEIETGREILDGFLATYASIFKTKIGVKMLHELINRKNARRSREGSSDA